MIITKKEFEAYEIVRQSGVTNMWDVEIVSDLSSLDKETISEIMKNYSELSKKFKEKKE